jgi:hypothetical protein
MGADGDVLQHAHVAEQAHVLEGAAHAAPGDIAGGEFGRRFAEEGDLAFGGRIDRRDAVEHGALAGAVRADQRHHLARLHAQAHVVVGDQAAEALGHRARFEQQRAAGRRLAARQRLGLRHLAHHGPRRQQAQDERPQAARAFCSTSTMARPKTMISKLPLWPSTCGSQSCSHCLRMVITPAPSTAPQTWPIPPTTTP